MHRSDKKTHTRKKFKKEKKKLQLNNVWWNKILKRWNKKLINDVSKIKHTNWLYSRKISKYEISWYVKIIKFLVPLCIFQTNSEPVFYEQTIDSFNIKDFSMTSLAMALALPFLPCFPLELLWLWLKFWGTMDTVRSWSRCSLGLCPQSASFQHF